MLRSFYSSPSRVSALLAIFFCFGIVSVIVSGMAKSSILS